MRNRIRAAVVTLALVLLPGLLSAQDTKPDLRVGSRVRVKLAEPSSGTFAGELQALTPEGIRLTSAEGRASAFYPADHVQRVSVYRGTESAVGRGAVIGGVMGGLMGATLAVAAQGSWFAPDLSESLLLTTVTAAGGAAIGALVGIPLSVERWEEVPEDRLPWEMETVVHLTVGLELGLAVPF